MPIVPQAQGVRHLRAIKTKQGWHVLALFSSFASLNCLRLALSSHLEPAVLLNVRASLGTLSSRRALHKESCEEERRARLSFPSIQRPPEMMCA